MQAQKKALSVGLMVGDFPVISETFVINIAAGLLDRGHAPRILALSGQARPGADMHGDVDAFGLMSRVARPALGRVLIAPFARRDTGEIHRWGPARRAAAFAAQAIMLRRQPRFDIVHCQFATLALQARRHLSLGNLRTRRLVIHVRGQDVTGYPKVHGEEAFRDVFRQADLLVANCAHFRRRAIALGAPPERTIVIGSGIDTSRFVRPDRERTPGGLRLIAVGRLVEKKGFEDAIAAMARLPDEIGDATLEIVGDGPLRAALTAQIAQLKLEARVKMLGAMSHTQIIERLARSDILVAPSVTARSGDQDAPVNTLKEAMAMEMPVIATRHGGIPELVEDDVNGLLVPERDPDALADAIRRLGSLSDRWREMGAKGRAAVIAQYEQRVVMDRLVDAYFTTLRPEGFSQ